MSEDLQNHGPADDEPGFPGFAPSASVPDPASPYRVLARKYRPQRFEDLIGQDAMVRTLANAFETGRIPQAWILTGVRGVGKTTTARILARGLNFMRADGSGSPTVSLTEEGVHCRAIMESRHVDVLEMDAASHTGVDDVRQINDGVRYAPISARYKVYIIDEVHMLSKSAFNAFLKTLEEPPPHAKFVFATTEIRQVPVTILSRCQRFDLRRVESGVLIDHLAGICAKEGVTVEGEALALIARAAEGSVRDSLSLLDQAIAHGGGRIDGETVRVMLGLADRARVIDLFEAVMRGDVAAAMNELRDQYDSGADPASIVADLAEFTHFVTRLKVVPAAAADAAVSESERERGRALSVLPMRVLSRAWQMLLKGHREVTDSAKPVAAAEMLLIRLAYAADLPTPDEALKMLEQGGATGGSGSPGPAPRGGGETASRGGLALAARGAPAPSVPTHAPAASPHMRLDRFEDLVALADEKRDIGVKIALERDVRLVRFEDGRLEFAPVAGASPQLAADLSRKISEWTGRRWIVALSSEEGAPTLREVAEKAKQDKLTGVRAHPLVQAVLDRFPGAQIVAIRDADVIPEGVPTPSEGEDDMPADFDFGGLDDDD
jgi:DNA polymerase-3 subunit gamma/tau